MGRGTIGRRAYGGGASDVRRYLHFMKWPLALRHTFGLAGHLTNLPFLSLHGAASDGVEPASRLSAVRANTNFLMIFPPSALGTDSISAAARKRHYKAFTSA